MIDVKKMRKLTKSRAMGGVTYLSAEVMGELLDRLEAAERAAALYEKSLESVVDQRAALAAYAELFKAKAAELKEQYPLSPWINQHYDYLVKLAPGTTSLSRRDAEKQIEILQEILMRIPGSLEVGGCDFGCGKEVGQMIAELRPQAEGSP